MGHSKGISGYHEALIFAETVSDSKILIISDFQCHPSHTITLLAKRDNSQNTQHHSLD